MNIQYGNMLIEKIMTNAKKIAGGLHPPAEPEIMMKLFPNIDYHYLTNTC